MCGLKPCCILRQLHRYKIIATHIMMNISNYNIVNAA